MKAEDLKAKTPDELEKVLGDLRREQFNQRFQRSQGTLENTSQIRNVRRAIARAKTFLNQQGRKEAPQAKPAKAEKPAAKKAAPKKKAKE
jgi:large subunit ribosomal protein L29